MPWTVDATVPPHLARLLQPRTHARWPLHLAAPEEQATWTAEARWQEESRVPWTADAPGRRTWLVSSSRGPTRVGPLHLAAAEEQATWTAGGALAGGVTSVMCRRCALTGGVENATARRVGMVRVESGALDRRVAMARVESCATCALLRSLPLSACH